MMGGRKEWERKEGRREERRGNWKGGERRGGRPGLSVEEYGSVKFYIAVFSSARSPTNKRGKINISCVLSFVKLFMYTGLFNP